jgi:hypothetical protein
MLTAPQAEKIEQYWKSNKKKRISMTVFAASIGVTRRVVQRAKSAKKRNRDATKRIMVVENRERREPAAATYRRLNEKQKKNISERSGRRVTAEIRNERKECSQRNKIRNRIDPSEHDRYATQDMHKLVRFANSHGF